MGPDALYIVAGLSRGHAALAPWQLAAGAAQRRRMAQQAGRLTGAGQQLLARAMDGMACTLDGLPVRALDRLLGTGHAPTRPDNWALAQHRRSHRPLPPGHNVGWAARAPLAVGLRLNDRAGLPQGCAQVLRQGTWVGASCAANLSAAVGLGLKGLLAAAGFGVAVLLGLAAGCMGGLARVLGAAGPWRASLALGAVGPHPVSVPERLLAVQQQVVLEARARQQAQNAAPQTTAACPRNAHRPGRPGWLETAVPAGPGAAARAQRWAAAQVAYVRPATMDAVMAPLALCWPQDHLPWAALIQAPHERAVVLGGPVAGEAGQPAVRTVDVLYYWPRLDPMPGAGGHLLALSEPLLASLHLALEAPFAQGGAGSTRVVEAELSAGREALLALRPPPTV